VKKVLGRLSAQDVCEIGGASLLSVGCFLINASVGFIVSGFSLLLFGVAMGSGRRN
jgi:hypothetical protein